MTPEQYSELNAKVDQILDISRKCQEVIEKVADQVKPTLDALSKSPILKMMGIGK